MLSIDISPNRDGCHAKFAGNVDSDSILRLRDWLDTLQCFGHDCTVDASDLSFDSLGIQGELSSLLRQASSSQISISGPPSTRSNELPTAAPSNGMMSRS